MDSKTQGAWIVHHTRKLQAVITQDFDQLAFSGKCGLLLSSIATQNQTTLPKSRVEALARANGISPRLELPSILDELERQMLIQHGSDSVEVLGLSTHSVLGHISTIFREISPAPEEQAVIDISETVSESPVLENELIELTSDTLKLKNSDAADLVAKGESIGFFDAEKNAQGERLVFNGNLFRTEDIYKVNAVMRTLSAVETERFRELNDMLSKQGCITLKQAYAIMTELLFLRLQSVGMFDVNKIGNETGSHYFVTRPAAFSKFTSTIADDAFDLAKAFVSALTYGMTSSPYGRGRIQMISRLMEKLISGAPIGPATAIGHDYRALEMRGVVEVKPSTGSLYTMRLLKPEVGRLALAVIQEGEATSEALTQLPAAAVSQYAEPESNRTVMRKNITEPLKKGVGNLLAELRTGGLKK
ncbi:hypothetical protein [Nitrosomonas sp.]|uniref:hypothetical protein n=1 Tax=Nitrosomonas sp. TaxID=42353 RepID=UPI00262050C4|nr:hypothetical protein [Nitrosomonas sp.]MCW5600415.1 hypothetical protein [Nitrosomonas sp.]